jgi:pyruvate carboxylase
MLSLIISWERLSLFFKAAQPETATQIMMATANTLKYIEHLQNVILVIQSFVEL